MEGQENPMMRMFAQLTAMMESQAAAQMQGMQQVHQQGQALLTVIQQSPERGLASPQTGAGERIVIPKMGEADDVEAFLATFEGTMRTAHVPLEEWAHRLLPLLTGEAQLAAHALPPAAKQNYEAVKRAVMDRTGMSEEGYRRRFRALTLGSGDRPFAYAHQVADAARRWLRPERRTQEEVIEQVVMEQFGVGLPAATAEWVRCHRPHNLDAAITLAEDFLDGHTTRGPDEDRQRRPGPWGRPQPGPRMNYPRRGSPMIVPLPLVSVSPQVPSQLAVPVPQRASQPLGQGCWRCGRLGHFRRECPEMDIEHQVRVVGAPTPSSGPSGKYEIPVRVQRHVYRALLDTGCTQTLIHQRVVRPEALVRAQKVKVRCVHGDVHAYPLVRISISYQGRKHCFRAAVSSSLSHPLILGTDWPELAGLVAGLTGVEKGGGDAVDRVCIALEGEGAPAEPEADSVPAPESRDPPAAEGISPDSGDFPLEQSRDETLKHVFDQVRAIDGQPVGPVATFSPPYFCVIKDRLYRVTRDVQTKIDTTQLLVPKRRRELLFQAAHFNPMGGHLGKEKTLDRLMARFYWPGIWGDVRRWCAACPECQLVNAPAIPRAPLQPIPLVEVPFDRIGMDLIGPLDRSARGYRFVLVIVDYATRYPEAVPLRSISANSVAHALFQVISRVGIPKEILTDQGTTFMSRTMKQLYGLLGIESIRTSVYHPQTDGLVERFNKTLKTMIRKFVHEDARNWDKWLDPLLFAVREVPQASTGFSPFELLFGRTPRGVLDLIKESWEEGPSTSKNEIQYVLELRAKLHTLGQLSRENLLSAQERQQRTYDKGTRLREFTPGEKVLVLLPTSSSKLLAKWQGPFVVTRRVGDVDYEVVRSDRGGSTQIYHLNLLKAWKEAVPVSLATTGLERDELGPEAPTASKNKSDTLWICHLSPSQGAEVSLLQQQFADVFSSLPGRTDLAHHHIETQGDVTVRVRPYRLPEHRKQIVLAELEAMLKLGVIEESNSAWSSPIVLVVKPDGTIRFCVDYRRVNEVSKFDAYPMPRVDELLDRLGNAQFFTTLDLTKGYWQIPLSPESREKSAFATPYGLYQFVTMPFGLFGAPATFQRLMDRVLRPHAAYAAAYIDDVIIHSDSWEQHMQHVAAVLTSLRQAGLTANPKKCAIGRREVRYLGYHLGGGQVRPQVDKTAAVADCSPPKTKKQVRRFLGLAGYYRRFIPGFAELTSPLTDLTRKGASDPVQWTEQCQAAFETVKKALCGEPLLHTPNFDLPFVLQTDASNRGLGAVLSQEVEGVDRPVLYLSRKLSDREGRYSTVEKECLAIKWAVGALRYYLLGRPFTLCSDHAPLQWLHKMKDTNARITRWYLALQPFNFKVVHKPGVQMVVADFLSRLDEGGEEGELAVGQASRRPQAGVGDMWHTREGGEVCGARGRRERAGAAR